MGWSALELCVSVCWWWCFGGLRQELHVFSNAGCHNCVCFSFTVDGCVFLTLSLFFWLGIVVDVMARCTYMLVFFLSRFLKCVAKDTYIP